MDMDKIENFVWYVMEFYRGEDGLYDLGFNPTREDVLIALALRLSKHQNIEFGGDSTDRELVRDIMLQLHGKEPWGLV